MIKYSNELYHHGILGQKWGVRRYQNYDGTRTSLGKSHQKELLPETKKDNVSIKKTTKSSHDTSIKNIKEPESEAKAKRKLTDEEKKKIALYGVGALTIAAAGYYVYKHPEQAKTAYNAVKNATTKVVNKDTIIKGSEVTGKVLGKAAGKTAKVAGKAAKYEINALNNAVGSIGKSTVDNANKLALEAAAVYGAKKVSDYYSNKPKSDNKVANKVDEIAQKSITDALKDAPNKSTKNNSGNKNNNSGNTKVKLSEPPSNKGIDKSSSEYQDLFKGQDQDTRATIKSLANNGYDIDQIRNYLDENNKVK